ncbi:MAG TPA: hypothetical protein VIO14_13955 [Dehalococcoidia bacterium]
MAVTRRRYVPPRDPEAEPACLLTPEAARLRREPPDALLADAASQETWDGGAEFRFPAQPGTWERVATFIQEEGECCPFFAFEQREEDGQVVLRILWPGGESGGTA